MKELSYEELRAAIDAVPVTYVPALLVAIVKRAVRDKVFAEGGLARTVERASVPDDAD